MAVQTVAKTGKSISKDQLTFGKYLKEAAGKARYKIQVLMPLCASGCMDFVAFRIIPAKIQTAIRTKMTILFLILCEFTVVFKK